MSAIKAINAMRQELGLEEGDYRAMLARVTGKASLKLMSDVELNNVAGELRRVGGGAKGSLQGPFGPKLQALWISGYHLGVVRNRDNAALLAFVKGQTGIDHTKFLRDAAHARKAVEALKAWLGREAGVDWSEHLDPAECVIAAQLRLLGRPFGSIGLSATGVTSEAGKEAVRTTARHALMALLGEEIRASKAGAA
jgi:hypothetical protein